MISDEGNTTESIRHIAAVDAANEDEEKDLFGSDGGESLQTHQLAASKLGFKTAKCLSFNLMSHKCPSALKSQNDFPEILPKQKWTHIA